MYCFAIVSILQVIMDYGFSLQVVKDISEDKRRLASVISASITVKHFVTLSIYLFSAAYFYFFNHDVPLLLFFVLLVSATVDSYLNYFLLPYQALEDFKTTSRIMLFYNTLVIVLILIGIWSGYSSPVAVGILFLLARTSAFIVNFLLIKKGFKKLNSLFLMLGDFILTLEKVSHMLYLLFSQQLICK
ncbi:oligosaccharide flippase family protein [Piscirickettsia litoralis]|uniref:Polysaccharide biosynthesis protein C-terminal domain-containing protein n=1 Tax=Piscirickettsia litoralis TaxID=1891921 RepID=A0ABX3AA25_9GAMM|nr:oligosaccharide flippase family protein [Piscirickettsia litoralis]ODN42974.1 hypothetical protein BGC07_08635 [Piscirickettsia litoralis]